MEPEYNDDSPPSSAEPTQQSEVSTDFKVSDPGQLIAAVPAFFGFVPSRSVVIAFVHLDSTTDQRHVPSLARFDIDAVIEPVSAQQVLSSVDALELSADAIAVMAIIIDDRPVAAETASRVLEQLQRLNTELTHAWLVPQISSGTTFQGLLPGDNPGTVSDPSTSPDTAARVLGGVQIRISREDLVELLTPDPAAATKVAPHLGPAEARFRAELSAAVALGTGHPYRRARVESILTLIRSRPETSSPEDLATVMTALRNRAIRDMMFGLAGTAVEAEAQMLWHDVARASTGTDRAEAATLCAYFAYYNSEGTRARICIDAALHADPSHSIAARLDDAIAIGTHPDRIRWIAELGRQIALDHDIDMHLYD